MFVGSEQRRTSINVVAKFEDMEGLSRHRPGKLLIWNKAESKKKGHAIRRDLRRPNAKDVDGNLRLVAW